MPVRWPRSEGRKCQATIDLFTLEPLALDRMARHLVGRGLEDRERRRRRRGWNDPAGNGGRGKTRRQWQRTEGASVAEGAGCPLARSPKSPGKERAAQASTKKIEARNWKGSLEMSMRACSRKTRLPKHIPLCVAIMGLHLNIRASLASCLGGHNIRGSKCCRFGKKGPKEGAS